MCVKKKKTTTPEGTIQSCDGRESEKWKRIESRYKYRYYQLDDINITINYIDCCRYTIESCGDLDAIITQKLS